MKYITREEFIKYVYPLATEVKEKYNITRIISITQSAHESNFGNSTLAIQAKNLFGIKATESWTKKGGKVWLGTTWENIKGKDITLVDGFRMYDTWRESFLDWAELISKSKIYKNAYEYAQLGDIILYGKEITGKYATDPKYSEKLIKVCEVVKELCKKLEYEI
jgi:flagellar protein FlgJ